MMLLRTSLIICSLTSGLGKQDMELEEQRLWIKRMNLWFAFPYLMRTRKQNDNFFFPFPMFGYSLVPSVTFVIIFPTLSLFSPQIIVTLTRSHWCSDESLPTPGFDETSEVSVGPGKPPHPWHVLECQNNTVSGELEHTGKESHRHGNVGVKYLDRTDWWSKQGDWTNPWQWPGLWPSVRVAELE